AMGEQDARFGLIHADLIPDNLLHHERMLRPIDFDDSGFGWHLFDIATILFAYLDEPFYESVEDALFAGYRSVRALDDSERARLPLFMLLRSLTYLGWIQTRADTAIAQDLAPLLIDRACRLATRYTQDKPAAATKADGG
ncbi:MAG: phosphotransferase enzyme family protein, partial [Sphingopyxis sp.]